MPFTLGLERKRPFFSCSRCLAFEIFRRDIPHSCHSDPLVSHGRHFGRTIHALCNIQSLLTNGLLRLGELAEEPEEAFTYEWDNSNFKLYNIFKELQTEAGTWRVSYAFADGPRSWRSTNRRLRRRYLVNRRDGKLLVCTLVLNSP
jgi:hypothetical protein